MNDKGDACEGYTGCLGCGNTFDARIQMARIWFSTETDSKLTTELSPFSSYIPECDA